MISSTTGDIRTHGPEEAVNDELQAQYETDGTGDVFTDIWSRNETVIPGLASCHFVLQKIQDTTLSRESDDNFSVAQKGWFWSKSFRVNSNAYIATLE